MSATPTIGIHNRANVFNAIDGISGAAALRNGVRFSVKLSDGNPISSSESSGWYINGDHSVRTKEPPMRLPSSSDISPSEREARCNSLWKFATQGGPLLPAALGDYASARSAAGGLYSAGTYENDFLGTQNPESIMSLPMQHLVPGGHFGEELTDGVKRQLDMGSAEWAQVYFWGKIGRYAVGIAGNVAMMNKPSPVESLTDDQRFAIEKNFWDWSGNVAFALEKLCYAACLGAVTLAQCFGSQSAFWHVGYIGGASILFGARALATAAWYSKVKCGALMIEEERRHHSEAQALGDNYRIDSASLSVAYFNFANAVSRIGKHAVALISFPVLLGAFYAPELFSSLRASDYVSNAADRLGGTGPEHIYRWMNCGFVVPSWVVIGGALLAGIAPAVALGLQSGKTISDLKEYRALRLRLAAMRGTSDPGIRSPEMANLLSRLAALRREHVINGLGMVGGVSILGAAFSLTYPALEPHALFLTAIYGGLTFLQFTIREWETVKRIARAVPERLWHVLCHPVETYREWRADRKENGGFWRRMREGVREAVAVIKLRKRQEKAAMAGMGFCRRWKYRWRRWIEGFKKWRELSRSVRMQKNG